MAIYKQNLGGTCAYSGCIKQAMIALMRSGTDKRAEACLRHADKVGKELAERLGEDFV